MGRGGRVVGGVGWSRFGQVRRIGSEQANMKEVNNETQNNNLQEVLANWLVLSWAMVLGLLWASYLEMEMADQMALRTFCLDV